jgi:hypothetical protein
MSTSSRTIKLARERLCLAALAYAHHSSGGTAPLEAGSLLRIRAKEYAQAITESVHELEKVT